MPSSPVDAIFGAWSRGKSALVYGPPGTGKTRVLSELLEVLQKPDVPVGRIGFDASDPGQPFKAVEESSSEFGGGLPKPIRTVWLTFHQSLGYEDFVVGLHPESVDGEVLLAPRAGVLLEAIAALQAGFTGSVVLFIDEINRGNAAKIFGEFLTFLDVDYRETRADGSENARRVPLPLRHLAHSADRYEPLRLSDGSDVELTYPSYFPRHLYVVATMNSVDRTAIPIDSALARRFERIDLRPDLEMLAGRWSVDLSTLAEKAATPEALEPCEAALLLLDRLNHAIAENFGADFELGHSLVLELDPASGDAWEQLARIWDRSLFPQLEDRFSGRPEELAALLRIEEFSGVPYAWRRRRSLGGETSQDVLANTSLTELDPVLATSSLQLLASRSLAG